MGLISAAAHRLLNRTANHGPFAVRPEVAQTHGALAVVDLLVGTPLFSPRFLDRRRDGHVDLPRLLQAGVDLVGLSIATRHPDLRGTLSNPHLRSLGFDVGRSNMALAERIIDRIEHWSRESRGRLVMAHDGAMLELPGDPGPETREWGEAPRDRQRSRQGSVVAFLGIQGGHVLDGDLANLERLHARGVRMLSLAHVMDNDLVGSNTGVRGGGLTGFGREAIVEMQRLGIVVDLAHMSSRGVRDALPLLRRPFVVSHTGFTRLSGRRSWRRFSPANRNLREEDARLVGQAGGVIGVVCATQLLGGPTIGHLVDSLRYAVDLVGPEKVAIGSDFDGGFQATFDVTGLPLLTQSLLDAGLDRATVARVMGGNALRVLLPVLA